MLWRSNLLGSSAKGDEYFLKYLLGTHSNVQAPEPTARPSDVTWRDDIPEGKLDLLVSADFRMTSTTMLSDVVLPAATWYEKHDLSSTDMHPFVHAFSPRSTRRGRRAATSTRSTWLRSGSRSWRARTWGSATTW